jgi:hypothetical protein
VKYPIRPFTYAKEAKNAFIGRSIMEYLEGVTEDEEVSGAALVEFTLKIVGMAQEMTR